MEKKRGIHETDPIFFQISQKIVGRLKREENLDLADSVYITLTDHLATSVERGKKGLYLSNKFIMGNSKLLSKRISIWFMGFASC
jgi:hypothetical protein